MIEAIRHIGVVSDDIEASLAFYQNYLGFEVEKDAYESGPFIEAILAKKGAELRTIKMFSKASEVMVELVGYLNGSTEKYGNEVDHIGPTHFAVTEKQIDTKYELMKTDGIQFLSSPQVSPDGTVKVVFCQAPEGNYIEMVELLD